jgi:protein-L-isoaspartate(D-aspartate) O-methyltransferase
MVEAQLVARGIRSASVLAAFREVPRDAFVPAESRTDAYADTPLPISEGQTISQPYIVAAMIEALHLRESDRVLEVGTGSGYAAAILARLARTVVTIERHASLADEARTTLAALHVTNVIVVHGDGTLGVPEHAPYDAIVVAAAGPRVPDALVAQLAEGGRLVMPVGARTEQVLVRITRSANRMHRETLEAVRFVPLVGEQGWPDRAR